MWRKTTYYTIHLNYPERMCLQIFKRHCLRFAALRLRIAHALQESKSLSAELTNSALYTMPAATTHVFMRSLHAQQKRHAADHDAQQKRADQHHGP